MCPKTDWVSATGARGGANPAALSLVLVAEESSMRAGGLAGSVFPPHHDPIKI